MHVVIADRPPPTNTQNWRVSSVKFRLGTSVVETPPWMRPRRSSPTVQSQSCSVIAQLRLEGYGSALVVQRRAHWKFPLLESTCAANRPTTSDSASLLMPSFIDVRHFRTTDPSAIKNSSLQQRHKRETKPRRCDIKPLWVAIVGFA